MKHHLMKPAFCLYLTGFILLLLSGCTDDDNPGGKNGNVAAEFSGGIVSRASDTTWDAFDEIGISMVKAGTKEIANNTANRLYQTDATGSGKFSTEESQEIYFPQDGTEVNFKAYYPYKDDLAADHYIPVDVSSQNELPAIDLMTAEHLSGFSKESPQVSLRFYHRLTKLSFNINVEDSSEYPLAGASLTATGMNTTAVYDLFNEQLIDKDGQQDIGIPFIDDPASRTAIVLPREAGNGVAFTIGFPNGESFTAQLKEDLELKAGYHYKFSLQLKKNELAIGVTIEDWEDGGTHSNVFIIDTTTTDSEGMKDGDEIDIYLKNQSGLFEKISTYTYDDKGIWNPNPIVYWSNIPGGSGEFRASMIRQERYNSSQMPEIFTSGNVVVLKNHFARFNLKREVARVVFQLKSTDGAYTEAQLQKMTITLPDYVGGGELINGEFIPGNNTQSILVENGVGDQNKSAIALIQEQTRSANSVAANILNPETGMVYQAKFNNEITFQAGYSYVLEINLNLSAVILGVKILPWEDGEKIDLTGKVEISGSLEGNDDFFKDQTISIYDTEGGFINNEYNYKYDNSSGDYQWEGPVMYWEQLPNRVLSISAAYYPSGTKPNLTSSIPYFNWIIDPDQRSGYQDYDLLWCKNQQYSPPQYLNLKFEHAMSKVIIKLKPGDGFTTNDLKNVEVRLLKPRLRATVNMINNQITSFATNSDVIPEEEIDDTQFSCLIAPQDFPGTSNFISVMLQAFSDPFYGSLGNDFEFLPGKQYEITITVDRTRIQMSATVKDWENGSSGNITIQ